jgi:hypothetical protein
MGPDLISGRGNCTVSQRFSMWNGYGYHKFSYLGPLLLKYKADGSPPSGVVGDDSSIWCEAGLPLPYDVRLMACLQLMVRLCTCNDSELDCVLFSGFCRGGEKQKFMDTHTKVDWTDISKKDVEFSI